MGTRLHSLISTSRCDSPSVPLTSDPFDLFPLLGICSQMFPGPTGELQYPTPSTIILLPYRPLDPWSKRVNDIRRVPACRACRDKMKAQVSV